MEPIRPNENTSIVTLLRAAADRHAVPRQIALAFAWLESHFDPRVEGDLNWPKRKGGELYQSAVKDNPKFAHNPARLRPELWHSYGLFQLLAPYHCGAAQHPRDLLDPAINAEIGCAFIAALLKRSHGDSRGARLGFVGCGIDGHLCSELVVSDTVERLHVAMQRFAGESQS